MSKQPTKRGLIFYPASHRYKLDGEWVPGVTTILNDAMPKPGLMKWSAKAVAEYVANERETVERLWNIGPGSTVAALKEVPWDHRDKKAERGKEVHQLAAAVVTGEEVEVEDDLVGHVESCIAFMDAWGIKPILTEQPVGSRLHKYAGTFDLIADHDRGPTGIFDFKTGGIYESVAFQNVAYAFAEFHGQNGDETPMADYGIQQSWVVQIRADDYDIHPLPFGPNIYDEFIHLRRAAEINKRAKGDWKVPGSGYVGVAVQDGDTFVTRTQETV
jgi:hypothetical protein